MWYLVAKFCHLRWVMQNNARHHSEELDLRGFFPNFWEWLDWSLSFCSPGVLRCKRAAILPHFLTIKSLSSSGAIRSFFASFNCFFQAAFASIRLLNLAALRPPPSKFGLIALEWERKEPRTHSYIWLPEVLIWNADWRCNEILLPNFYHST